MGAEVERTAPDIIEVEGRRRLRGADHQVIADRIEAGTFVVAAAVTGGEVTLQRRALRAPRRLPRRPRAHRRRRHPAPTIASRSAARTGADATSPRTSRRRRIPGLATDLQPPTAVLLTQARGTQPHPRDDLRGSPRVARGPAARWAPRSTSTTATTPPSPARRACTAPRSRWATCAPAPRSSSRRPRRRGPSVINGAHHVRRGYENIERKFLDLGARIEQVPEPGGRGR